MPKTRTSFKKGKSGNPKGAPKREWTWAGELRTAVEKNFKDGTPIKQAIISSLFSQAVGGNVMATKEIMNRMDGLPEQKTDITTKGEKIESNAIIFTDFTNDPNAAESK